MSEGEDHHVEPEITRTSREPKSESDPTTQHGTGAETRSPKQEVEEDPSVPLQRSHYPLNSKKLTVFHLRTITEALGLPPASSADQLCQSVH